VSTESTNNIDQGVEENNDISGDNSSFAVTNGNNIQRTVYAGIHSMANNTGSISGNLSLEDVDQINNIRPLVVVAVRGSVTMTDWVNNFRTQLTPWDNKFVTQVTQGDGSLVW